MVRPVHTFWPMMLDTCNPWHLSGLSIGPMARSALDDSILGEVCAVFARTFYVRTKNSILCVGAGNTYNGPLTIVTNAPETTSWQASGVRVRQRASLRSCRMAVGQGLVISCEDATEWIPPRPPAIDAEEWFSRIRGTCEVTDWFFPHGGGRRANSSNTFGLVRCAA